MALEKTISFFQFPCVHYSFPTVCWSCYLLTILIPIFANRFLADSFLQIVISYGETLLIEYQQANISYKNKLTIFCGSS